MIKKLLTLLLIIVVMNNKVAYADDWVYMVSNGDSLWTISEKYLKTVEKFSDLQQLNNINRPKELKPGMLLRIPIEWLKTNVAPVIVLSIKGEAVKVSEGDTSKVTTQTTFTLGDELRLSPNAHISLLFADGSRILLTSESILKFDHLTQYGETGMVDTRLRLEKGKIQIKAAKQHGAGSRFDVKSASAITAVRGTEFRVGLGDSDKATSSIEVVEGAVQVAQQGQQVDVGAGFAVKVTENEPISEPIKLLDAPDVLSKSLLESNQDMIVKWTNISNSQYYQIIISTNEVDSKVLHVLSSSQNHIELPDLSDGHYKLELSAYDNNNLQGMVSSADVIINRFPTPPSTEMISHETIILKPTLTWLPSKSHSKHHLQIATDSSFNTKVFDKSVEGEQLTLSSVLKPSTYYWRIASYDDNNNLGPYSETYRLKIKPDMPNLNLRAYIKNDKVLVTISPNKPSLSVIIETSQFEDFEKINRVKTKKEAIEFPIDKNQPTMFLRAKTVSDQTGDESPWTSYCRIKTRTDIAICELL